MNIGRLFRTVRHLQARQFFYRLYYPFKKQWWRPRRKLAAERMAHTLTLRGGHPFHHTTPDVWIPHSNGFALLNKRADFGEPIDWAYGAHGLLWTYHLHYFNYLRNEDADPDEARILMHDYLHRAGDLRRAPYPASLRIINWTAFALRYGIDEEIAAGLFEDAQRLAAFPEYQIGANHLLTNGFGIFHAAVLFGDARLMRVAERILYKELRAQIPDDGGHYERSPGYHAQLLSLLMSCIAVAGFADGLLPEGLVALLRSREEKMGRWLCAILPDGCKDLAVMGDTNQGMLEAVGAFSRILPQAGSPHEPAVLKECRYRRIATGPLHLLINAGPPAPAFQPGHSHADPLSFVLYHGNEAIITHHGCSTYERGPARDLERSTRMHNCITPESGENAAELWAAFRMGRRPVVEVTQDVAQCAIEAWHDGYRKAGFLHRRRWEVSEGGIVISDVLEGAATQAASHLHFHPDYPPTLIAPYVVEAGGLRIVFRHYKAVHLRSCRHADGFHKTRPAICIQGLVAKQSALIIQPIIACS